MAGEGMEIEVAEKQLKSLDHSEQHYFNRYVLFLLVFLKLGRIPMLIIVLQL